MGASDATLVAELRGPGAEAAMAELFARHARPLLLTLLPRCGHDWWETEDVAAETWLRAWLVLPTLPARPGWSIFPWLRTVGGRIAIDRYRRRRVRPALSLDWLVADSEDGAGWQGYAVLADPLLLADQAERIERAACVRAVLGRLSAKQRWVLLAHLAGWGHAAIGARWGGTPIAGRAAVVIARRAFRREWVARYGREEVAA